MVGHKAYALAVEDILRSQLLEHLDRDGGGDVVCKHKVELALDKLPGPHLLKAGMCRQYLFSHGHSSWHFCSPPVVCLRSKHPCC